MRNKAGRDVTGRKWCWPQVSEAFKDPQLYFCMLNAFLSSVPNGLAPSFNLPYCISTNECFSGLTTFGSLMYQSFGFTQLQVQLVDIPRSGTPSFSV